MTAGHKIGRRVGVTIKWLKAVHGLF
jgi:hypothetical protein